MPILEVKNLIKSFGNTEVLRDISFTLEKGEGTRVKPGHCGPIGIWMG